MFRENKNFCFRKKCRNIEFLPWVLSFFLEFFCLKPKINPVLVLIHLSSKTRAWFNFTCMLCTVLTQTNVRTPDAAACSKWQRVKLCLCFRVIWGQDGLTYFARSKKRVVLYRQLPWRFSHDIVPFTNCLD